MMKIALLTLCLALPSLSQIREGRSRELGVSGAFQNVSRSGGGNSTTSFWISTRLGFFAGGGLEIEPELSALFGSGFDPAYLLNGNVSYNFPAGSNGVPFLLAGYGIANTVPFMNVPLGRVDYMVGVLNLGAGMKIFLNEDAAIRLEYRFQSFSGSGDRSGIVPYTYTPKTEYRLHTVQFGFSVLN